MGKFHFTYFEIFLYNDLISGYSTKREGKRGIFYELREKGKSVNFGGEWKTALYRAENF